MAPLFGQYAGEKHENDIPILGNYPIQENLTFSKYMDALENTPQTLNIAAMIGLGAVRISLNGFSDQPLTSNQLADGRSMIQEALDSGACGVSAGIMYLPEFYTTRDEYLALLNPLKGGRKPFVTHIRGEGAICHSGGIMQKILPCGGVVMNIQNLCVNQMEVFFNHLQRGLLIHAFGKIMHFQHPGPLVGNHNGTVTDQIMIKAVLQNGYIAAVVIVAKIEMHVFSKHFFVGGKSQILLPDNFHGINPAPNLKAGFVMAQIIPHKAQPLGIVLQSLLSGA